MDIVTQIKQPSEMRYDTVGDWKHTKNGVTAIAVDTKNKNYNALLLLHELIEGYLTKKNGVTDKEAVAYDKKSKADEPGDSPDAPYHLEHTVATAIENRIADELGVDKKDYNKVLNKKYNEVKSAS